MTMIVQNKNGGIERYTNIEYAMLIRQKNNGDWIHIAYKANSPEYEMFKNQKGEVYIGIDLKYESYIILE